MGRVDVGAEEVFRAVDALADAVDPAGTPGTHLACAGTDLGRDAELAKVTGE